MKLIKILTLLWLAIATPVLTSCDDDPGAQNVGVSVMLTLPSDVDASALTDATYTFHNVSTGADYTFGKDEALNVLPGLYDISFEAHYTLPNGNTATLRANAQSVNISAGQSSITLTTYSNIETDDLIISEIFYTGTVTSTGKQYHGDQYVKLYNNTDHVIYADGLTFFESKFLTTQKFNYDPDIMGEAITVDALYTVPGSGKDHPVQPGEYFILADAGMDHRSGNPLSFDLSHADFEWYDLSTSPSNMDIDTPTPNLDKWYCYTKSYFLLHNRGFKAYGIARIPVDKETYLKDYYYTYNYDNVTSAGTFPMSQSAYRLPNEWVVDVVNLSIESNYKWTVTAPVLDSGWTYCGTIDKDKTRYFHAVRRKLLHLTEDGRAIFQDTNNSSADFNGHVTPSEIENQGTAVDVSGKTATTRTYDGINPIK